MPLMCGCSVSMVINLKCYITTPPTWSSYAHNVQESLDGVSLMSRGGIRYFCVSLRKSRADQFRAFVRARSGFVLWFLFETLLENYVGK